MATKTAAGPRAPATQLVTAGRDPRLNHGFVNPPVYHASTVLYPNAEDYVAHRSRYQYGRRGTPTSGSAGTAHSQHSKGRQCAGVALLPSGLAAISTALLSVVPAGDHILVTDSVYRPTRNFCEQTCSSAWVSRRRYYDPLIGPASPICSSRIRARSIIESPGSQSFEMQDVPRDRQGRARQRRAGADGQYLGDAALLPRLSITASISSIQAGTKYIGGHSDIMFG